MKMINPKGLYGNSDSVLRGGSWFSEASILVASNRGGVAPSGRGYYLGLRIACNGRKKV